MLRGVDVCSEGQELGNRPAAILTCEDASSQRKEVTVDELFGAIDVVDELSNGAVSASLSDGGRGGQAADLHGDAKELPERLVAGHIGCGEQRIGYTELTGTTGSAGSVDVDLSGLGQVIVDDGREPGDVDAARGNIGGDEELDGVAPHPSEGPLTLILGEVAIEDAGVEALSKECLVDAEGGGAGVCEDDGAVDALGRQDTEEGLELGPHRGAEGDVLDAAGTDLVGGAVHLFGVVEQVGREALHIFGDRCAAEKGLAVLGQHARDFADILFEAEREHLVGLVEAEEADLRKAEPLALDDVEESPRRCDDDVGVGDEGELFLEGGAAVDGRGLDAAARAEEVDLTSDLLGEFARGCEYEAEHAVNGRLDLLDHRDAEGGRLAGAGLGAQDGVFASNEHGNGPDLNRGGSGESDLLDGEKRSLGEAEVAEGGF